MFTIAVIDDSAYMRKAVISKIDFKNLSLELVGEAQNGEEGLKLLKEAKPSIAIVDINMPVMDGLSMIREAKLRHCKTKFILLSSYSDFEFARLAVELSVKAYLLKPVTDKDLNDTIEKVICELKESTHASGKISKLISENVVLQDLLKQHNVFETISEKIKLNEAKHTAETPTKTASNIINPDNKPKNTTHISDTVKDFIESHLKDPELTIVNISKGTFINYSYLCHCFKRDYGITVNEYIIKRRMENAKKLFSEGARSVGTVAKSVGYASDSYFSKAFKKYYGISPTAFVESLEN